MRHGSLSKMDKGRRRAGGWFLPPCILACPVHFEPPGPLSQCPISPTSHLLWGELISCQKEGGSQ